MEELNRSYWAFVPETLVGLNSVDELGRLLVDRGIRKPLLVTGSTVAATPGFARAALSLKDAGLPYAQFAECKADSPIPIVLKCAELARREQCDAVVGIGGGSPMDTAKLVSVLLTNDQDIHDFIGRDKVKKRGLFKVLIPTTAGTGSEWSHPALLTDDRDGFKKPVFSRFTAADLAIIDPLLSLDLPPRITADTGFDALCHCIEAYGTWKSNIIAETFAEKGIELVGQSLRLACHKGRTHIEARYRMCIAAAYGMAAHTSSCAGIAHSMNYPITAKTHVSHGTALGLLMGHVMEFNLPVCAKKYARVAALLGENVAGLSDFEAGEKAVAAVKRLCRDIGMPAHAKEVGFTQDDIPAALDFLYENQLYGMENNPRDPTREDFTAIYRAAL